MTEKTSNTSLIRKKQATSCLIFYDLSLSVRKAENMSVACSIGMSRQIVASYFKVFRSILFENNILNAIHVRKIRLWKFWNILWLAKAHFFPRKLPGKVILILDRHTCFVLAIKHHAQSTAISIIYIFNESYKTK